jgi:hypothetical protein
MQSVAVHFPDRLRLRGPRGLRTAIEMAAAAQNTTPSEWSRRALLQGLQADGLHLRDGQIAVVRSHRPQNHKYSNDIANLTSERGSEV